MAVRTFTRDFTIDIDASTRRTFPEGWSGEVDAEIAAAADEAGVTDKPAKSKGKASTQAPAGDAPATEDAPAA